MDESGYCHALITLPLGNMVLTELKAGWAPEFSLDVLEKREISSPHSVI